MGAWGGLGFGRRWCKGAVRCCVEWVGGGAAACAAWGGRGCRLGWSDTPLITVKRLVVVGLDDAWVRLGLALVHGRRRQMLVFDCVERGVQVTGGDRGGGHGLWVLYALGWGLPVCGHAALEPAGVSVHGGAAGGFVRGAGGESAVGDAEIPQVTRREPRGLGHPGRFGPRRVLPDALCIGAYAGFDFGFLLLTRSRGALIGLGLALLLYFVLVMKPLGEDAGGAAWAARCWVQC